MFRKFALATLAAVIGMIAAAKLTSAQHITISDLLDPHKDRPPSVVPADYLAQMESQSAKENRPTFTPAVAHSAR